MEKCSADDAARKEARHRSVENYALWKPDAPASRSGQ